MRRVLRRSAGVVRLLTERAGLSGPRLAGRVIGCEGLRSVLAITGRLGRIVGYIAPVRCDDAIRTAKRGGS